jgi:DNA phosphorothioation-dependent restriction protein DptG
VAAVTALAAGCSPLQDTKSADTVIADFHQKLNTGDFAGIYNASSPELKAADPQDKIVQVLSAIHRKLGMFKSGKDTGWNDRVTTGGHFLSIGYAAQYERGTATESFTFRVDGAQARLAGFNVNSEALLLN